MKVPKKFIQSLISFIVALIVALVGFNKVKTSLGYLLGVPVITWVVYLLTNAMCTDLLFGETLGCSEESIYKDQ